MQKSLVTKKSLFLLNIIYFFISTISLQSAYFCNTCNVSQNQNMLASIEVVNSILLDDDIAPKKPIVEWRKLPSYTYSNITVDVTGEAGSRVYLNHTQLIGTITADGNASISLPLVVGENNFSMTLKDDSDIESVPSEFTITRHHMALNIINSKATVLSSIVTRNAKRIVLSKDETKAYLADGEGGFKIIDINNSNESVLLGSIDTKDANYIILSKDETKVYLADGAGGFKIIDISNPKQPILVGSMNTFNSIIKSIALSPDGTKVYIAATDESRLYTVDINNIYAPKKMSYTYLRHRMHDFLALSIDGTKLYASTSAQFISGLEAQETFMYDIASNPYRPKLIDKIVRSSFIYYGHIDFYVHIDNYALTFSPDSKTSYTLRDHVLSVNNSDSSKDADLYLSSTHDFRNQITLSSDYTKLYIPNTSGKGFQIVDIIDPATPKKLGSLDTGGDTYSITPSKNTPKIYVADGTAGFKIIDINTSTYDYPKNFTDATIDFKISNSFSNGLGVNVTTDRDDIITIGDFNTDIGYSEFISIPINSVANKTGQTIITLTLHDYLQIAPPYIHKIIFNVHP